MTRVWVRGVGVVGPGLDNWDETREVLGGRRGYQQRPTQFGAIPCMSAAERRRLGVPVRLALQAGLEAVSCAECPPSEVATVFSSSGGDAENVHRICETLTSSEREVSPTRFHNAVHNAAAGYWSIATGAGGESTTLCCHDASFAAGLIEAVVQVETTKCPVALIAYDHRYPQPLHAVRPIAADFATALVLAKEPGPNPLAALTVSLVRGERTPTAIDDPALEVLRSSVPAARALPLLVAIATRATGDVVLDYLDELRLTVRVSDISSDAAERSSDRRRAAAVSSAGAHATPRP